MNFNYSPEQVDELKLQAGEIVEVIKEVRGWTEEGLGEMMELVPGVRRWVK